MIELAVIRHLASDRARRLGSVFFNPGGPGGSGVQALPSIVGVLPSVLVARFDWVSWDPRGVGASTAVQCFASQAAEKRFLADTGIAGETFPVGQAQMKRWIGRYRTFDARCQRRNGPLLAHISTADTARDLDLLRRAVGDRSLNYLGTSYGTFLGATYANLFPNRVRAMVLSSNIAPRAWIQGAGSKNRRGLLSTYLRQGSDQGSAKTLSAFLKLCGRTDAAHCAFSAGSPAATRAKFGALLARLRKRRAGGMSYANLVSFTLHGLYSSTTGWNDLAKTLQKLWASASPAFHARGLAEPSRSGSLRASAAPARSHRYSGIEQLLAITCAESPNPPPAAFPRLDAFASHRSGLVAPPWVWLSEPCASWPAVAADRYAGPWNRRTANPVLVIGTAYDPATPYQGSVAMSRQLARARLLTVDGYGHGTASPCTNRFLSRYLLNKTLPPKGARCAQSPQPFSG